MAKSRKQFFSRLAARIQATIVNVQSTEPHAIDDFDEWRDAVPRDEQFDKEMIRAAIESR